MAARHASNVPTDQNAPVTASDALSLHTIAEQADTDSNAAQEQEDADFAIAHDRSEVHNQGPTEAGAEPFFPYRDDPDARDQADDDFDNLSPYRDDPDAAPADNEENTDTERATVNPRSRRLHSCLQILRKAGKAWCCCLLITTTLCIIIFGVILILVLKFGNWDPKEVAWRDSRSNDGDLNLPKLYPSLEEGATEKCKETWEKHAASLECHHMILSSAWDNSDVDEVKSARADPHTYAHQVCTKQCQDSIAGLRAPLRDGCKQRIDRFNFIDYGKNGKAYFSKDKLEEGPVHVAKTLMAKYDRLCAQPPKLEKQSEWGTCAAELWKRWGIVDGINEANLKGLEEFLGKVEESILSSRPSGGEFQSETPQKGEAECGFCALDWLERKMRSFEYGQILDQDGKPVGLKEFDEKLRSAIEKCEANKGPDVIERVHKKWEEYGWWCNDKPCRDYRPVGDQVRTILHGVRKEDFPLPELRRLMKHRNVPKKALQTLHDSMLSMPCFNWFSEEIAMGDIIPHHHVVHHLCSDRCRNAVDRIQQQHGDEFAAAAGDEYPINIFKTWPVAQETVNKTCRNEFPDLVVEQTTSFCAPGFAALGQREWFFAQESPSKPTVVSVFRTEVDKLAEKLPHSVQKPAQDPESQRIFFRKREESMCNPCAGELLIGRNPTWRDTVQDFLDNESVDGREYTRVAKKYIVTCAKMAGTSLSSQMRRHIWEDFGLDRYD